MIIFTGATIALYRFNGLVDNRIFDMLPSFHFPTMYITPVDYYFIIRYLPWLRFHVSWNGFIMDWYPYRIMDNIVDITSIQYTQPAIENYLFIQNGETMPDLIGIRLHDIIHLLNYIYYNIPM